MDLWVLFHEVLKHYDHTIIYGKRSEKEQNQLYKQGRRFDGGVWVIDNYMEIVTYKQWPDSKHNVKSHEDLSIAVDAAPYINGRMVNGSKREDEAQIYHFAGFVLGVAKRLKAEGKMSLDVRWGGDWDMDDNVNDQTFNDLFHFELV